MTYITGDTHGSYSHIEKYARRNGLSPNDVVICLGDTGLNYYGDARDDKMKDRVARIPVTLLCVHGNHDRRPGPLPGYRPEPWRGGRVYRQAAYPSILFAQDGARFELEGKTAVVAGGAYSVDKAYRLEKGYNWFADEQPSPDIKRRVEGTLAASGWAVDTLLSHTCPLRYLPREALFESIDQSTVDFTTERWLETLEERLCYRRWFCGHFHIDKQVDKIHFLYKQIQPF